jgi:hypothetical protein
MRKLTDLTVKTCEQKIRQAGKQRGIKLTGKN